MPAEPKGFVFSGRVVEISVDHQSMTVLDTGHGFLTLEELVRSARNKQVEIQVTELPETPEPILPARLRPGAILA